MGNCAIGLSFTSSAGFQYSTVSGNIVPSGDFNISSIASIFDVIISDNLIRTGNITLESTLGKISDMNFTGNSGGHLSFTSFGGLQYSVISNYIAAKDRNFTILSSIDSVIISGNPSIGLYIGCSIWYVAPCIAGALISIQPNSFG